MKPLAVVTLVSTLLLTACSPDDEIVPVQRSGIVLFTNTYYVDYSDLMSPGYLHEARNLYEELLDFGLTFTTFTGTTSIEIDGALAAKAVFVIPELESGSLYAGLDEAARISIRNFVLGGGKLVLFHPDSWVTALLNGVFGFSTSATAFSAPATLNASAALGTPFDGGPATLTYNNDTTSLTSLPAGTINYYPDAGGNSAVAVIPYGAGRIVVLGWDWWNAIPLGTLGGAWVDVLYSALTM
jgi:hypothetical protein